MTETIIGIDISKDHLDVYCGVTGDRRRFPNDLQGFKLLRGGLAKRPVKMVVYEPTGPYHGAFERSLSRAGLPLAKVNPRQARSFAVAAGQLTKTDQVDARLLAYMGQALELRLLEPANEVQEALRELHGARQALIKDQAAAGNREAQAVHPLVKRQHRARLRSIAGHLKAVEAEIHRLIAEDPALSRRWEILCSVPGVGPATAQALLIEMPELGTLEPKKAAKLAGLAPITRQSGQWQGRSFIQGGRASLRRALFMPALVACRYNPDLKAKYEALKAAGKPRKVAVVAVMRKLLLLANALIQSNRMWVPKPSCR